jgi:hypothetical protein
MALTFSQLFASKQVNNAAPDTLFTVPASPTNTILRNGRIRFANTTAGAVTIKAWAVPAAGTAADSNVCLPTLSLAANTYTDVDLPVLGAGGFVQAQAGTASSITASMLDGFTQS